MTSKAYFYISEDSCWMALQNKNDISIEQPRISATEDCAKVYLVSDMESGVAQYVSHLADACGDRLYLASPYVMGPRLGERPPAAVSYMLNYSRLPASLGGWRPWSESDRLTLQLLHLLTYDAPESELEAVLRRHPVWPVLSFVWPLAVKETARLISYLVDPRWYVDPWHPDRWRTYFGALGLRPKIFQRLARNQESKPPGQVLSLSIDVAAIVFGCWARAGQPKLADARFVWEAQATCDDPAKGYCRASRCFAKYLRMAWTAELVSRPGQGLFVPELFFEKPAVAAAYRRHRADLLTASQAPR